MDISLEFTFSTQTDPPPTSNQVRLNDADQSKATLAYVRPITNDGIDAYYYLRSIPLGARLILQDKNDHTRALEFATSGPTVDRGTYFEIPLTGGLTTILGAPPNNQAVLLIVLTEDPAPGPPRPGPVPGSIMRAPWGAAPHSAYSIALTEPDPDVFTIAEAKLRAGLDWPDGDPRDALMTSYIAAARQKVEQDTGLALLEHDRAVFVDVPAAPAIVPWPTQTTPLVEITSIVDAASGTVLDPTTYPPDYAGRVVLPAGAWRLDIVAGYPTPEALVAAHPLLVHAVGLLTAHYATFGRDLATTDAANLVPQGYDDAIAGYRPVWLI